MWPFARKPKNKELTESVTAIAEGEDLDALFVSYDDEFLSDLGAGELDEVVTQMLQDDQVSTEFETLKTFIGNSEYIVDPPDENDTELSEKYVEYLNLDGGRLITQVNNFYEALSHGHVICEVIWKDPATTVGVNDPVTAASLWAVNYLKPLDHSRYGFNKRGEMVNKETGKLLDAPYKYVSVSHDVRGGNLTGNSLLLKAYWPWKFRKACITAGLLYVKKAVIPSIVAIYKAAKNKDEKGTQGDIIAEKLSKLANSTGVALANVESITSIDASSKGTDIIDLVEMFNRMISKAILGVATLTNDTRYSNRGDTTSQEQLIEARAKKISTQEIQPAINTILMWTAELNLGDLNPEKIPLFKFIYEYDPAYAEVIEAVKNRIPISGKWFYTKYNVKPPEDDEDLLVEAQTVLPAVDASVEPDDSFFLHSKRLKKELKKMKTSSHN